MMMGCMPPTITTHTPPTMAHWWTHRGMAAAQNTKTRSSWRGGVAIQAKHATRWDGTWESEGDIESMERRPGRHGHGFHTDVM